MAGNRERFRGLPPTYIPLRNMIFYSLAASYAEEVGACCIIGGHNRDDLKIFRDTRPLFFNNMQASMRSASAILSAARLTIQRPLRGMTKVQVIRRAYVLGVPLGLTWSCHLEGTEHCWRCAGCQARREKFRQARVPDPLQVETARLSG